MTEFEIGDGVGIRMVYDGTSYPTPSQSRAGNFLGIWFFPSQGGRQWVAVNGDWGEVETEEEARKELIDSWNGVSK